MRCPFCQADNDRVTDSRASEDGYTIRRRRQCLACKRRYTTYERIERSHLKVVKKDGARVPSDRSKLMSGLDKACWKRPISDSKLEAIVWDVENHVETHFESEVESRYLGELVMRHLRELDQVAYVRFASVYREFEDGQPIPDDSWRNVVARASCPRRRFHGLEAGATGLMSALAYRFRVTTNSTIPRSASSATVADGQGSCSAARRANQIAFSRA